MILHFVNGTPEQQAFISETLLDTGGLSSGTGIGVLVRSLPHTVTIEFVPRPGPRGTHVDYFAYTTTFPNLTATMQFDTIFPNYPAPFDGEDFARETVAHELAHILQSFLTDGDKAAIGALMDPAGGTWESDALWQNHIAEADAETVKDVLNSLFDFGSPPRPGRRKFANRTAYHVPEIRHDDWLAIHNESINPAVPVDFNEIATGGGREVIDLPTTPIEFEETLGETGSSRSYKWDADYSDFFGLMANVQGTLVMRARMSRPLDPFEFLTGLNHVLIWTFGGTTGPFPIGTTPFPENGLELSDTDWFYFQVPLPVNPFASVEAALAGDASTMQLPYHYQYRIDHAYDNDFPPPLIELEVVRAFIVWSPSGIFGPWVAPHVPPLPPPVAPPPSPPLYSASALAAARRALHPQVGIAAPAKELKQRADAINDLSN